MARFLFGKIAALAGLALVAIGISLIPAQPSMAASCYGSSCAGLNPQTAGCSTGAVSKGNIYSTDDLTVEMRYSSACDAWWARATCESPNPQAAVYVSFIRFTNGVQSSKQRLVGDHAVDCYGGETTWTYMIPDLASGDHYNACWSYGIWGTQESPDESDYCTGRI